MRTATITLLAACFTSLVGCQKEPEPGGPLTADEEAIPFVMERTPPHFDAESQRWLRRINDPFALDNIRQAYKNLATGDSPLSAKNSAVYPLVTLEPTHYHLKIKPSSEAELEEISTTEGVVVGYYPFDTEQVPEEESRTLVKPANANITIQGRYFEDPGLVIDAEGNEFMAEPWLLPIIWAVWPRDLPIPEGTDHEKLYDVYLPEESYKSSTSEFTAGQSELLEQEAVRLATGASGDVIYIRRPSGKFTTLNHETGEHCPLSYVKVRIKNGSSVTDIYTNRNGEFAYFHSPAATSELLLLFEYENTWIIADNNNNLYTWSLGNIKSVNNYSLGAHAVNIHLGTSFWFLGSHQLTKEVKANGGRIKIHAKGAGSSSGTFFSSANYPYIHVYNNGHGQSFVINTTCHELGHAGHYLHRRGKWKHIDKTLKESWATFTGWYVWHIYHESLGKFYSLNSLFGDGYQDWNLNTSKNKAYSPLFIDLRDDYNQRFSYPIDGHLCPNDRIKNVPVPVIEWLAFNSKGTTTLKENLQYYVGMYYTQAEMNDYLDIYLKNWDKS